MLYLLDVIDFFSKIPSFVYLVRSIINSFLTEIWLIILIILGNMNYGFETRYNDQEKQSELLFRLGYLLGNKLDDEIKLELEKEYKILLLIESDKKFNTFGDRQDYKVNFPEEEIFYTVEEKEE